MKESGEAVMSEFSGGSHYNIHSHIIHYMTRVLPSLCRTPAVLSSDSQATTHPEK